MSYVIPGTTTLIFEFNLKLFKVGYAGDYFPLVQSEYSNSMKDDCFFIIEKYVKEFLVDSILIIENEVLDFKLEILKFVFDTKLCGSVIFLSNILCNSFGFGKTSCVVLNWGFDEFSAATVLNGIVTEKEIKKVGYSDYIENISYSIPDTFIEKNPISIIESEFLTNDLEINYNFNIFNNILPDIRELIKKLVDMRNKYKINKKNISNGCIILSGPFVRYDSFINLLKSEIFNLISVDFSDFILCDKTIDCTFVGASLFASNDLSKPLFITPGDFKLYGNSVLEHIDY